MKRHFLTLLSVFIVVALYPERSAGAKVEHSFSFPMSKNHMKTEKSNSVSLTQLTNDMTVTSKVASVDNVYDEPPLIREGVEWGYYRKTGSWWTGDNENCAAYRMQFKGTKEVDGKVYHNLYLYTSATLDVNAQAPYALMREENGKIYRLLVEESESIYEDHIALVWLEFEDELFDCKEHLLYDFSNGIEIGSPSPLYLYQTGALYLSGETIGWVEANDYNGKKRRVFYNSSDGSNSNEDNRFTLPFLMGAGPIGAFSGNMAFPYAEVTVGADYDYHILLYERDADGTVTPLSDNYDKYAKYDPTISGITLVEGDQAEFSIENRQISCGGNIDGRVAQIDGRLLYQGNLAGYTFPAPGIYLVSTSQGQPRKVVIR